MKVAELDLFTSSLQYLLKCPLTVKDISFQVILQNKDSVHGEIVSVKIERTFLSDREKTFPHLPALAALFGLR